MRPYQIEGLNWLSFCWNDRRNCILADEMGLGKTVQSVVMVDYLATRKLIRGPFLVIAPLSSKFLFIDRLLMQCIAIPHWKREFEGWTDLNTVIYHGTSRSREIIKEFEWNYTDNRNRIVNAKQLKFNVLVTTYEMIISDFSFLKQIQWKYVVVDEAHRLKNKVRDFWQLRS